VVASCLSPRVVRRVVIVEALPRLTVAVSTQSPLPRKGPPLSKTARERMDVIAAYESVGTYRGAAEICGTTHKTVRRMVEADQAELAGASPVERKERSHNYDPVAELVTQRVKETSGRISAKRLLPPGCMLATSVADKTATVDTGPTINCGEEPRAA
jgi:hypothetical protein